MEVGPCMICSQAVQAHARLQSRLSADPGLGPRACFSLALMIFESGQSLVALSTPFDFSFGRDNLKAGEPNRIANGVFRRHLNRASTSSSVRRDRRSPQQYHAFLLLTSLHSHLFARTDCRIRGLGEGSTAEARWAAAPPAAPPPASPAAPERGARVCA